jgi:chromate transporter
VKVGALSYGGGFVIVPLMQADAVGHHHWMSSAQFLNAVALGQVTPGPVTQTVAVVGYAAAGIGGALLASLIAFVRVHPAGRVALRPVTGGCQRPQLPERRRAGRHRRHLGTAVPLAGALSEPWQYAVLAAAAVMLLALRRGVVPTLLLAGAVGGTVALGGGPLPH